MKIGNSCAAVTGYKFHYYANQGNLVKAWNEAKPEVRISTCIGLMPSAEQQNVERIHRKMNHEGENRLLISM